MSWRGSPRCSRNDKRRVKERLDEISKDADFNLARLESRNHSLYGPERLHRGGRPAPISWRAVPRADPFTGTGGQETEFSSPGDEPRGEHDRVESTRCSDRAGCDRDQGRDRETSRTGSELRVVRPMDGLPRLTPCRVSVVVSGPSGVGKTVLCNELWLASTARSGRSRRRPARRDRGRRTARATSSMRSSGSARQSRRAGWRNMPRSTGDCMERRGRSSTRISGRIERRPERRCPGWSGAQTELSDRGDYLRTSSFLGCARGSTSTTPDRYAGTDRGAAASGPQ